MQFNKVKGSSIILHSLKLKAKAATAKKAEAKVRAL